MRGFLAGLLCVTVGLGGVTARADAYRAQPKLVVVLVLDQFRGDYLDRYREDFKTANGFNLFLKRGAYFTDCYYDYANTMTAPGHSTIGTGAYSDGHGIATNDWWDLSRSTTHTVSSVEDERYRSVGGEKGEVGASPRNEAASTLGDEVVLATGGRSKLYGISLKDRAAILTSGHASRGAFWLDHKTGAFESSTYWMTELPGWAREFNGSGRAAQAAKEAGVPGAKDFYEGVGSSPASVSYLLDFAKALVTGEQMGRHDVTDVLTISISSTDILGHQVGPDAPEQRAMIDAVDVDLNDFFTWLDGHVDGGLGNVWVALTGDHGVAPTTAQALKVGMPAATFDAKSWRAQIEQRLNARFSPGQDVRYVLGGELPYIQLDSRAFEKVKVDEAAAESAVAGILPEALEATLPKEAEGVSETRLLPRPQVRYAYTRVQIAAGQVPATDEGRRVLHSYSPNEGWYVMTALGMYELPPMKGTTHFAPYSYDRHVPLAFFGSAFVPGTYHDHVAPVDIAATFASLLRVNQPSACVGHVLTEAIRPEKDGSAR